MRCSSWRDPTTEHHFIWSATSSASSGQSVILVAVATRPLPLWEELLLLLQLDTASPLPWRWHLKVLLAFTHCSNKESIRVACSFSSLLTLPNRPVKAACPDTHYPSLFFSRWTSASCFPSPCLRARWSAVVHIVCSNFGYPSALNCSVEARLK